MRRPRTPLAARRRARGLSQESLAARLGVDRSTVARWEGARTAPQPVFRPRLAAELGWSPEELHAALAEVTPAETSGEWPGPWASDAVRPGPARRDGTTRHMPVRPRPVDEDAVLDLHDHLYDLATRYDTVASRHLVAPVTACHRAAVDLAGTTRDPALLPRVRTAAAEAAILLGRVVWDASARTDSVRALARFTEALGFASAADDHVTGTHALLRTSYVALYGDRDPLAGAAHARRAATSARHSPSLRALALLHVAEAHAMLGEARDCEATLDAAHALFADTDIDDVGRFLLDPAPFPRLAGACELRLGRPARSRALLEEAVDLPPTKTTTLILGTLARALTLERHLDAAVATLHRTVDQLAVHRGAAGTHATLAAVRDLDPWRTEPRVATLRDRLHTLGLLAP
ncbi:hypothetical protein Lfu02_35600 [Longispora fulva]|uniref:DNA-binding XRE family transcriptional regulator n=1 Tax=Longispora fulva TaxID=619741 RepID=A0A8J7KUB5_9ACTN|nr:helix-turn-helix transcriptional regulator [Longispora fulva]MBG6141657.1 DNA-binding XRE family transcriptional regulator [Longispora fulva]GIG59188.1 hypothetical protein Lfu02_35600 [Longispora fulva]